MRKISKNTQRNSLNRRRRRGDSADQPNKPNRSRRLDSALSVFFSRELESIKSKTYDKKYPELMARRFIPPSPEMAPAGAESITWRSYDRRGMAKLISGYADDLPRIEVVGSEDTSPIKALGASFGYSWREVKASMMAGKNLPQKKSNAARRAVEEGIDEILAFGNTATGIPGFLNNANVPTSSVSGGTWATKAGTDPDLILDDISDMVADMSLLTKGVAKPNTLLMPPAQMTLLALTRLVDQNGSVLDWLKAALAPLGITTIESWWRLTGAGSGSTDRMVLYRRDPDLLEYQIPEEVEIHDAEKRGLEWIVPVTAIIGGTIIFYPLEVSYRDGI